MSQPATTSDHESASLSPTTVYVAGFSLSVIVTLLAFWAAVSGNFSRATAAVTIAVLALIQFCVQALCFLHIGSESKPRYKQIVFGSMLVVVIILVAGSLWIMNNLHYHMMDSLSPADQSHYLRENEGI